MIKAEVIRPSQLGEADRMRWRAWRAADPRLASPLLGPDFAQAVGAARPDARVAILHEAGEPVGYFAFHVRGGAAGRPIGSPFSDYHAVIPAPGRRLEGAEVLPAAGLSVFRYGALIDPGQVFGGVRGRSEGFLIRNGGEAYLEQLREADPKRFKNWRRLTNKLEREAGALAVTADEDPDAYALLLQWKRDQLWRTGLHDFLGPAWARGLMQSLFERRSGEMRGLMVTLRAGGQVLAGHFGVVENGHYHSWISSMHPEAGAWAPGQTLLFHAIQQMPRLGITAYDLAPGHAHYKAPFCTSRVEIAEGAAVAAGPSGLLQGCAEGAWALAGRAAPNAAARLRRRWDHIAALELSMAGRVRGMVHAVTSQGRRHRSASAES